ncbi:hypothetical protein C8J57DRAFT_1242179 [Mycena rebaudengoi]|nr:hypothetical protein C8J57DRAFT_1242179 [Mycena rebaudengoi]
MHGKHVAPRIFPSSACPLTFRQASRWLGVHGVALAVLGAVAHARSFPTDSLQVVPATVRCVDKGGLMELQLELELGLPARVDGSFARFRYGVWSVERDTEKVNEAPDNTTHPVKLDGTYGPNVPSNLTGMRKFPYHGYTTRIMAVSLYRAYHGTPQTCGGMKNTPNTFLDATCDMVTAKGRGARRRWLWYHAYHR